MTSKKARSADLRQPSKKTRSGNGRSANAGGRPKKPKDHRVLFREHAAMNIATLENGKAVTRSKLQMVVRALVQRGLKGDLNAIRRLWRWARKRTGQEGEEVVFQLSGLYPNDL